MRRHALRLQCAALLLLSACAGLPSEPGSPPVALDALPRPLTAGEQGVVRAVNDFSFSLFRGVTSAQADSNVFVSPLSASYALGMTMNGASGTTLDQMRTTLGFGAASEAVIDSSYQGLSVLLRGLDPQVELRIANSVWYDQRLSVDAGFVDRTKTFFDAKVAGLDFRNPASVTTINDWVSGATAGKIPGIVQQLEPNIVMVVVNAIYFKGSWRTRFDAARTIDAPFHGAAGDQPARLMYRDGEMPYLSTTDFEAVDLPYGDSAFTMTVVLPRAGVGTETVAASLQSAPWATWMAQMHSASVNLFLPKLTLTWERRLDPDLEALGMRDAFRPDVANFSRLSSLGSGVFISAVRQKTFVDVNEEGTEAAAATSVEVGVTSARPSVTVRVDRPYIMVIRERLSGTVLFMGRIARMP